MAPPVRRIERLPRGGANIVLTEKVTSRELTEGSGRATLDLEYDLRGTSSESIARTYLVDNTPRVYANLFRMELTVKPIQVDVGTDTGHWFCTVRYATGDVVPRELTDSSFMFDTGGGTAHITNSYATFSFAPPGVTPTNHHGAIRVGPDLKVEGVDIPSPVYNFAEAHIFVDQDISSVFKARLFYLTGRMNDASFKGFRSGECLFLGVSGMRRGSYGNWDLHFRFSASPNTMADEPERFGDITVDNRLGWDVLWVDYGKEVDSGSDRLGVRPIAVYVERVLRFGDFSLLQIGT